MSTLQLPEPTAVPRGPTASAAQRAHRHFAAGRAFAAKNRWPDALKAFQQAARLFNDTAHALYAAHAAIRAGQARWAVSVLSALRAEHAELTLAYTLEAKAWLALSRPDRAVATLEALPASAARDHAYHLTFGTALQDVDQHGRAARELLAALRFRIDDAETHYRMGMSFKDLGSKAEAAECVRTALVLGLGASEVRARGFLAYLEREACRWDEAERELAQLRKAVQAMPDAGAVEANAFVHAVLVDDPLEVRKIAAWQARHLAAGASPLPRRGARAHDGRLRIGYLSADFHQHATSQLTAQTFEAHDRARFEVTLFSAGPDDGSALRRRMCAASEHFVDLRGLTMAQMADVIRERKVDILIDVKGDTNGGIVPVMARRPAPIQVNWLGFPGTSGADFIDYLIGDAIVTPLQHEAHFSERIAQMPLCYQPNDSQRALPVPQPRSAWGLPEHTLVLCGFHQSYKISREVFDSWCRLLHALPDAVLWLLCWNANVQGTLTRAAAARGIDPARLVFADLLPAEQHFSRLASADVFLDTWPCNAHTTASEALWAGVPVVSVIGTTFAQRVAASLLHAYGVPEGVCRDVAHYEETIIGLAGDRALRESLRQRLIAQRTGHRLFDGARFARDLEALYERMWARAVAGRPPQHLPAQPGVA